MSAAKKAPSRFSGRPTKALLKTLIEHAKAARANAHAPYSEYPVGAAIATHFKRCWWSFIAWFVETNGNVFGYS